jgi:hypothetical protein
MKYSDFFHARGIRTTSLFVGCMSGLMVGLLLNWQYGLLSGAIIALISSFLLPLMLYREERPYTKIKESIAPSFLVDERVRFTVRQGSVGGYFLLTDDRMIFLSLERGEHRLELSRKDVQMIIAEAGVTVRIYLNNTQFIRMMSGMSEEICEILRQHGWSVSDAR